VNRVWKGYKLDELFLLEPGNYLRAHLVYTGKTTRGVGG
jgi:hypothetical protein